MVKPKKNNPQKPEATEATKAIETTKPGWKTIQKNIYPKKYTLLIEVLNRASSRIE